MKLKKSKKTGLYSIQFKTEHGERSVSTGVANRADALKVAKQAKVEELELASRAARLTPQVVTQILSGRDIKINAAFQAWEQAMQRDSLAPLTIANKTSILRTWIRDSKTGDSSPASIKPEDIDKWINDETSQTKRSSRMIALAALRSFFSFCANNCYCLGNPARSVRIRMNILSHKQKETREKKTFTDQEVEKLQSYLAREEEHVRGQMAKITAVPPGPRLDHLQKELDGLLFWKAAVAIGYWTGLRLGDVCQLEWDCFGKPERIIVWTDKRDRRVTLPMTWKAFKQEAERIKLNAEQRLKVEASYRDSEAQFVPAVGSIPILDRQYCFPSQRECILDPQVRSKISVQFMRLCERAGVEGHSFHDFRHTFCTRMDRLGLPVEHIARSVGHMSHAMTEHYIH